MFQSENTYASYTGVHLLGRTRLAVTLHRYIAAGWPLARA